jgi:hypothetical protein
MSAAANPRLRVWRVSRIVGSGRREGGDTLRSLVGTAVVDDDDLAPIAANRAIVCESRDRRDEPAPL